MHLIAPLMSYNADAAGGYATIYRRGTTTAAQCYSDFEGATAISTTTAQHTLGSDGRVERYVNELVDVTIYNSSGTAVAGPFVAGDNATAVEVRHAHITGTDYSTGVSALNNPSTVQLVLDKLYTSIRKDDFLAYDGTPLGDRIIGGVYDVKGPEYGAVGDGTTDDTVAIQAAIDDAVAAGGRVWFPPGTYKITAALTISGYVELCGVGGTKSVINNTSATALTISASKAFLAVGLGFTPANSTGGNFSFATDASDDQPVFIACKFTSGTDSGMEGSTVNPVFYGCEFVTTAATGFFNGTVTVIGGKIRFASGNVTRNVTATFVGVDIKNTAGALQFSSLGGTHIFLGCAFSTSGTSMSIVVGGTVREAGCTIGSNVTLGGFAISQKRDGTYLRTSGSATSYAPNANETKFHEVVSTGASFQWSNPSPFTAASGAGTTGAATLVLRYKNTSGGAITPTFGTAYKASAVSVANGSACGWFLVYDDNLACWCQIGSPVAYAS